MLNSLHLERFLLLLLLQFVVAFLNVLRSANYSKHAIIITITIVIIIIIIIIVIVIIAVVAEVTVVVVAVDVAARAQ